MTDPFARLQRTVALLQANRPLPADLAEWLLDSLTRTLRGADPALIFGTRAEPSTRRPSTRARHEQRDGAIADLFAIPTGSIEARAAQILEWFDGTSPPPPEAVPLVRRVRQTGLPVPDVRRLRQIFETSAAARCMTAGTALDTVASS